MKKEELIGFMEDTLEKAKELLLRDGKLVPVAFMYFENNIEVIGLLFRDNHEKNLQLSFLKKLVKEKKADAILILTEAWYVISDKKCILTEPSKHPMRRECIFISGECEKGTTTIMQEFDRKDGDIVFGEKIERGESLSLKFDFGIKDKKKQHIDLMNLN